MLFFFDESGDFGFPLDRFDSYTQAGVIYPESEATAVDQYVQDRCERWGLDELHATHLSPGRRIHVCRFIAGSNLQLVAQGTDSEMVTRETLARHRAGQAETIRRNLDWYRTQGGDTPEVEAWLKARAKSSELPSRISDTEFVQADLLVDLVFEALQKSLIRYIADEWRPAFEEFRFTIDAKLSGKLGPGEKFLQHALVPILGSNARFDLVMVDTWKDAQPPHPFIANFERPGGWSGSRRRRVEHDVIDISAIFENGLDFKSSKEYAGLQLADVVANVVRRAVLEPNDWQAQAAYDLLRPKLRGRSGTTLSLFSLPGAGQPSRERYAHLMNRDD
jgi:hypothetical protein